MNKYAFLVASAVVCASMSVVADDTVQGGNVFGILTVLSKSTDTIVAVPWCECSTNENKSIAISNIVKTANLSVGDELYALNDSREKVNKWELSEGEGGVKYWNGIRVVVQSGSVEDPVPAEQSHAARGSAIILHRQNPTDGNGDAKPFYLYGQVGNTSTVTTQVIVSPSEGVPAYTLVSPPNDADVDIIADNIVANPASGDSIVVRNLAGVSRTYTYNGTNWVYYKATKGEEGRITVAELTADSITIKCGTGAWYVSRTASDPAPSFNWQNVPAK